MVRHTLATTVTTMTHTVSHSSHNYGKSSMKRWSSWPHMDDPFISLCAISEFTSKSQVRRAWPHLPRVSELLSTVSLTFLATLATASPIFLSMQTWVSGSQPLGWSAAHKGVCAWGRHRTMKHPPASQGPMTSTLLLRDPGH